MSRLPEDKTTPETPSGGPDTPRKPPESWSGFQPYAQLCRALLPRAQGISLFDARGALRWSTDKAAAADLKPIVAGTTADAGAAAESAGDLHMLPGNVPAYLFRIRDDSRHLLATVVVTCAPSGEGEVEVRSFSLAHASMPMLVHGWRSASSRSFSRMTK